MRAIYLPNSVRMFMGLLTTCGIFLTSPADAANKTYLCKLGQAATLKVVEQNGRPIEFEWEAYDAQQRSCGLSAKNSPEDKSDWKYAVDGKAQVYLYNYSDGTLIFSYWLAIATPPTTTSCSKLTRKTKSPHVFSRG